MPTKTWIIVRRSDGKAIQEIFNPKIAEAIDRGRYEVLEAGAYLKRLNRQIKEQSK